MKKREKSVVVVGEKKMVNKLLIRHARIQGDYGSDEEVPLLYQPTRSYPVSFEDPKKKSRVETSIKVSPVFEEKVFFRKAVLDTLSADIFLFVYSASSLDSLDEIRDKYIFEIREYEEKIFAMNEEVLGLYSEEVDDERPRIPVVLCGVSKGGKKCLDQHTIDDCSEDIKADLSIVVDLSNDISVMESFRKIAQKCHEFIPIIEKVRKKLEKKKTQAEKLLREKIKQKHDKIRNRNDSQKKRKNTIVSATKRFFKPARKIFNSSRDSSKLQINEALENIERFQDNTLYDSDDDEGENGNYGEEGEGEEIDKEAEEEAPFELTNLPFGNYIELPSFLTVVFRCMKTYDYQKGVFDFDQDTEKTVDEIIKIMSKKNRTTRIFLNKYSEKILFYLVKIVMQSFPQPICSYGLYEVFLRTNKIRDRLRKIHAIQAVLSELPGQELEILGIILLMFKHIEKTLPEGVNERRDSFNHLIVLNDISLFLTPVILYSRPPSMVRFLEEKKCVFFMIREAENIVLPQFREKNENSDDDEFNDAIGRVESIVVRTASFTPYGRSLHDILQSKDEPKEEVKEEETRNIDTDLIEENFNWENDLDDPPEGFDLEDMLIMSDVLQEEEERTAGQRISTRKAQNISPSKKKEIRKEEEEEEESNDDLLENEAKISVKKEEMIRRRIREFNMEEFWKVFENGENKKNKKKENQEKNHQEEEEEGEQEEFLEEDGEWYYHEEEGEYYFYPTEEYHEGEDYWEDDDDDDNNNNNKIDEIYDDEFANWETGECVPKEFEAGSEGVVYGLKFFVSTLEFIQESMKTLLNSRNSSKLNKVQEIHMLSRRMKELEKFIEGLDSDEFKEIKKIVSDEEKIKKELESTLNQAKTTLGILEKGLQEEKETENFEKILSDYEISHGELINQRSRFNVFMQMFEDGVDNESLQKKIEDQKEKLQEARSDFDRLDREILELKKKNPKLENQVERIKVKNFENFLMF